MKKRISFIISIFLMLGLVSCKRTPALSKIQVESDVLQDGSAYDIIKKAGAKLASAEDYAAEYDGEYNGEKKTGAFTREQVDHSSALTQGMNMGKMVLSELPSSFIVNEEKEKQGEMLVVSCDVDIQKTNDLIKKYAPSYDIGLSGIHMEMVFDSDGYLQELRGNVVSEKYNVSGTVKEILVSK